MLRLRRTLATRYRPRSRSTPTSPTRRPVRYPWGDHAYGPGSEYTAKVSTSPAVGSGSLSSSSARSSASLARPRRVAGSRPGWRTATSAGSPRSECAHRSPTSSPSRLVISTRAGAGGMTNQIPHTESDHVLVDVRAKSSKWPTASLDATPGPVPRQTSGIPARRDPQFPVSTVSRVCRPIDAHWIEEAGRW